MRATHPVAGMARSHSIASPCRNTRGHKAAMLATSYALEPEKNRFRFFSVRGHGPLLQQSAASMPAEQQNSQSQ